MRRLVVGLVAGALAAALPALTSVAAGSLQKCGERTIFPGFSADGRSIAFSEFACDCSNDLRVIPTGGGRARLLTRAAYGWEWSPRGSRLAFVVWNPPDRGRLLVRSAQGQLTELETRDPELHFGWSPTGRSLAVLERKPGADAGRLAVIEADGSAGREIAPAAREFSWSPNGARLAYEVPPSSNATVAVAASNGMRRRMLAAGGGPQWSADGRWISFMAQRSSVIGSDGSGPGQFGGSCTAGSVWAPVGHLLAVSTAPWCTGGRGDPTVEVVDVESRKTLGTHSGYPYWSPTGRRLGLVHWESGTPSLSLVDPNGSHRADVVGRHPDTDPVWSPNGRWLAFTDYGPQLDPWIVLSDSAGARVRILAAGRDPVWAPSGKTIALVRRRAGCGDELFLVRIGDGQLRRLTTCRSER